MRQETTLADLTLALEIADLAVGLVVARGCPVAPSGGAIDRALEAGIARAKARTGAEQRKATVRDMLRHGRYKPTGRGKPASEYLHQAALEDRFPRINNLVDLLNLVSLDSGLPISLIDLERAASLRFTVRYGREGESYVFNSAGQSIDLTDLVLVAAAPEDRPIANPVKDSMSTKLTDASKDTLAVLFAPHGLQADLRAATDALGEAFERHAGARGTARAVLLGGS